MEKVMKPDIKGEMDEFQRISQDLRRDEKIDVSVEELVRSFDGLKEQTLTDDVWPNLENTESNEIEKGDIEAVKKIAKMYNKTDPNKLIKAIKSGDYHRPLILKMGERYILIAGNTRLCTAAAMGVNPKVFIGEIGEEMNESNKIEGGGADNKSLVQIAKKHNAKNYYQIDDIVKSLKKQVSIGLPVEMDHTDSEDEAREIVYDHLWEDPKYYTKLKKADIDEVDDSHEHDDDMVSGVAEILKQIKDTDNRKEVHKNMVGKFRKENVKFDKKDFSKMSGLKSEKKDIDETDTGSSGSFEGPAFGSMVKRKITSIPNANLSEQEEEVEEATTSSSSGQFDVPAFGKTTKGGRKDPLKIDGPDSIYKGRAVTDKKFPKWGGPGGVFVKVKEKCKKFPYCNQGNTGALEFIKEDKEIQTAINEVSKKSGIPRNEIEKIVLNEIKQIFI
jgi:hypothetical protein